MPQSAPSCDSQGEKHQLHQRRLQPKDVLVVHGVLWGFAFLGIPATIPGQAGVLGVWLVLGQGSIWARLLMALLGWHVLTLPGIIYFGGTIHSLIITIIGAAVTVSGVGAVLLALTGTRSRVPVRFRLWELIVGMAALGGAMALVGDRFDVNRFGLWRRDLVIQTLTLGVVMGAASGLAALPLMVRKGRFRHGVGWAAWGAILLLPLTAAIFIGRPTDVMNHLRFAYIMYAVNLYVVTASIYALEPKLRLQDPGDSPALAPARRVGEPLDRPAPVGGEERGP